MLYPAQLAATAVALAAVARAQPATALAVAAAAAHPTAGEPTTVRGPILRRDLRYYSGGRQLFHGAIADKLPLNL